MSLRNAILSLLASAALLVSAGCGSSSPKAVAPPSGGFSDSSLNGTYVFSTTGVDSAGYLLTIVGDFAANGSGTISSGALDVVSADPNVGVTSNIAVASSTYAITRDGRGQVTLNVSGGSFVFDLVLQSSSHGLVTEYDSFGTGSGTLDAVPATVAQTALTALTFGVSGVGTSTSTATVGTMTLDAGGNVTAGIADSNNGGTPTTSQPIASNSFVTVGTGTSPGTAQLVIGSTTYSFDVYAADSTHLKFIETDGSFFTSGDAYVPATALPSGTLAYTMAGYDVSVSPVAIGGLLPTSTVGVITAGLEDYNDGGTVSIGSVAGVGGGFSALASGRSVLTLTGFVNGAANQIAGTYTFAAYPFTSNGVTGVQLLEIDPSSLQAFAVTTGTAYPQSSATLTASSGYALNLSGLDPNNGSAFEEDDIAEFTTNSSNAFTGIIDLNDQSSLTFDKAINGSVSLDSTGRGSFTSNSVNGQVYAVNGSTLLFLESDTNQIGLGAMELQSASAVSPGIVQSNAPSLLHPVVSPHFKASAAK